MLAGSTHSKILNRRTVRTKNDPRTVRVQRNILRTGQIDAYGARIITPCRLQIAERPMKTGRLFLIRLRYRCAHFPVAARQRFGAIDHILDAATRSRRTL